MSSLVNVLEGGVSINTAQAPQYMAERGRSILHAKAFELGLWVEHTDGTVLISRATRLLGSAEVNHTVVQSIVQSIIDDVLLNLIHSLRLELGYACSKTN